MANSSLKQILNEARDSGALEIEGAKLDFAIALARLLEVSKMSRSELAKALQVSLPMVTKILRGDTNLTIETMVRAVRAAKGEPVVNREHETLWDGQSQNGVICLIIRRVSTDTTQRTDPEAQ